MENKIIEAVSDQLPVDIASAVAVLGTGDICCQQSPLLHRIPTSVRIKISAKAKYVGALL